MIHRQACVVEDLDSDLSMDNASRFLLCIWLGTVETFFVHAPRLLDSLEYKNGSMATVITVAIIIIIIIVLYSF